MCCADRLNPHINTARIITANWKADKSDDVWILPIGFGVGKIFRLGKLPMNTQIGYYKNVITPDNGADSQLRLDTGDVPQVGNTEKSYAPGCEIKSEVRSLQTPSSLLV